MYFINYNLLYETITTVHIVCLLVVAYIEVQ